MPVDEGGRVRVIPLAKSVSLPGVGKLDRLCTGVAIKGARSRVIPGYVRIERGGGALVRGGGRALAVGGGIAGAERVVALVGGTGGRVGAGAGRVAGLRGGIGGRAGASAWGLGAATLCDRSRMAAFIGSRVPWRADQVGMVWTACWILSNWVVMVSS